MLARVAGGEGLVTPHRGEMLARHFSAWKNVQYNSKVPEGRHIVLSAVPTPAGSLRLGTCVLMMIIFQGLKALATICRPYGAQNKIPT